MFMHRHKRHSARTPRWEIKTLAAWLILKQQLSCSSVISSITDNIRALYCIPFFFFFRPMLAARKHSSSGFAGFLGSVLETGFMAKTTRMGSSLLSSSSSRIQLSLCQKQLQILSDAFSSRSFQEG